MRGRNRKISTTALLASVSTKRILLFQERHVDPDKRTLGYRFSRKIVC